MSTSTQCCIVGAGPAGVLLALLLARKGVNVTLLKMHADLNRDFRGDTVHASTLEVLDQIQLADKILQIPHGKMRSLSIKTPKSSVEIVQFKRLKTRFPFVAMMPQVNFLGALIDEAKQFPNFTMAFNSPVIGLLTTEDRVSGVRVKREGKEEEISADLVVGCDGRFSMLRKSCSGDVAQSDIPMDVAWIRLPKLDSDPTDEGAFFIANGRMCILLGREHEWQIGYVFPKGDFRDIQQQGIEALQNDVATIVPMLANRVANIDDFSKVHLLNVKADRLSQWYGEGLLLLGDAAHVMSPVGGVGINYAIGDAVEAANVLIPAFQAGLPTTTDLAEIQSRREPAVKSIQRIQSFMQKNLVALALKNKEFEVPLIARILTRIPGLRNIPARIVALGFGRTRIEQP